MLSNILLSRLMPYVNKITGYINVDFNIITYWSDILHLSDAGEKIWMYINYLLTSKKAYDSVRRETLYNILIEFSIPMKLVTD
jgi:hypothetical protein